MQHQSKIAIFGALIFFLLQCDSSREINIYMIGDSTMSEYDIEGNPRRGWGQLLCHFFNESVSVYDKAISGASTKSFVDSAYWDAVIDSLKEGDYLFIQFGHNDEKENKAELYAAADTDYSENLNEFIIQAREKGAIPILITSIMRRVYDEDSKFIDTHGKYPDAMRKLAKETNTPLIDLHKKTESLIIKHGFEGSKELFLWIDAGKWSEYPDGVEDNSHLSVFGATEVCKLAIEGILELNLELENYLLAPNMVKPELSVPDMVETDSLID